MAPKTRRNSSLTRKIAALQLRLSPLVPLPNGSPHPAFPETLLAFYLLGEAELDSIASYYHQSTPGPWTQYYPAPMNWDKDFLAKGPVPEPHGTPQDLTQNRTGSQQNPCWDTAGFNSQQSLMFTMRGLQNLMVDGEYRSLSESARYAQLSDVDRIRIKRRKVGKFIGLVGMETPVEEIVARVQHRAEQAVERGRRELKRNEGLVLQGQKFA
nr:hypothetical protein CFP56_52169 [Quercus suber]